MCAEVMTFSEVPPPGHGYTYTLVSLSPDGKYAGALVTNGDQIPVPTQVTSTLIVWQITPPKEYAVVQLQNPTGLPVEGLPDPLTTTVR